MRKPFNRTMDVYTGRAYGSVLRVSGYPCRVVIRDESGGIPNSPPFYAWVTCPLTTILTGCQLSNLDEFNPDVGDRLYDSITGVFIGVVLWSEIWLPGTTWKYQRVYVGRDDLPSSGGIYVGFTIDCVWSLPVDSDTVIDAAFTIIAVVLPDAPIDTTIDAAFTISAVVLPDAAVDTTIDAAFTISAVVLPDAAVDTTIDAAFTIDAIQSGGSGSGSVSPPTINFCYANAFVFGGVNTITLADVPPHQYLAYLNVTVATGVYFRIDWDVLGDNEGVLEIYYYLDCLFPMLWGSLPLTTPGCIEIAGVVDFGIGFRFLYTGSVNGEIIVSHGHCPP